MPAPGDPETVVAKSAALAEDIDGASYMAAVRTPHRIGRRKAGAALTVQTRSTYGSRVGQPQSRTRVNI